jgi:hypothetical protein
VVVLLVTQMTLTFPHKKLCLSEQMDYHVALNVRMTKLPWWMIAEGSDNARFERQISWVTSNIAYNDMHYFLWVALEQLPVWFCIFYVKELPINHRLLAGEELNFLLSEDVKSEASHVWFGSVDTVSQNLRERMNCIVQYCKQRGIDDLALLTTIVSVLKFCCYFWMTHKHFKVSFINLLIPGLFTPIFSCIDYISSS